MLQFDFSSAVHHAADHWFGIFVPHQKYFILYLLTSLGMAWFVWRAEMRKEIKQGTAKGFFSYIFHPGIYNHKSSWQDYGIFLINGLVYYAIIEQFVLSEKSVSVFVHQGLQSAFGAPEHPIFRSIPGIIFFTLIIALLYDLSVYCAHYMFHKIPVLWAFHKVHHSAEVMTPITVLRLHPVELLFNSFVYAAFVGAGIGLFSYLAMQEMTDARVLGVNVIFFGSFLIGVHLRHSHVWLHYPAWLSHIFISPAQHQIHHSTAVKHFDKNLSLIFSFWDRMFGTLYVPKQREEVEFGINKRERNPYVTLKQMYFQPFRESFSLCSFSNPFRNQTK